MDQSAAANDPNDSAARLDQLEQRLAAVEHARRPAGISAVVERALRFLPFLAIGNLLIGLPALAISIGVAYFTFVQAEATEKMQVAGVWPRVTYTTSNRDADGNAVVGMSLINKGVGPAQIRGLEIRYEGKSYAGFRELLSACCSDDPAALSLGMSTVHGEVLRPGEEMPFAQLSRTEETAPAWERFDKERLKLTINTCYCSVFGDCWIAYDTAPDPQPVDHCRADWVQYTGFPQARGEGR